MRTNSQEKSLLESYMTPMFPHFVDRLGGKLSNQFLQIPCNKSLKRESKSSHSQFKIPR